MKKLTVFVVMLCLCFASNVNAQGACQHKLTDVKLLDGKAVLKSNNQPVNGVVCGFFKSGELALMANHKNGLLDGALRRYTIYDYLRSEYTYKNGILHGYVYINSDIDGYIARILYENGKVISGNCGSVGIVYNGTYLPGDDDWKAFGTAKLMNWENGLKITCYGCLSGSRKDDIMFYKESIEYGGAHIDDKYKSGFSYLE